MTNNNTTPIGNITWELFSDSSYYDMFAVRPVGDHDFNSPRLFHFTLHKDACEFKALVERAHIATAHEQPVVPLAVVTDLLNLKNEYIELLDQGIDGLIGMASECDWKSELVEEGIALRKKIAVAEKNFNQYLNTK